MVVSKISLVAPARIASLTMGVWFLASAVGNYLGGRVAGLYERVSLPMLFTLVTGFALLAALVLWIVRPYASRLLASSTEGNPA